MKDSLLKGQIANPEKHVFSSHLLRPVKTKNAEDRKQNFETWPAIVLFISVIILVFFRALSLKKSKQIVFAFFSFKAARQLEREEYRLNKATSLALSFLFLSSASLFLINLNDFFLFFNWEKSRLLLFFLFFGVLLLVYLIKFLLLGMIAWITRAENQFFEYLFNIFLTNKGIGVFLTPVLVVLEYVYLSKQIIISLGLLVCLFFYLSRLIRGIRIAYAAPYFSEFHLFLYLCVLEILPLVVLIKLLVSRF